MITMRGGAGLGDAIYLQSVARHLVERGHTIEISTNWPDVFRPLNGHVVTVPFKRTRADRIAHYSRRRERIETDQFQDCCIEAGLTEPIEFRLDWKPVNLELIERLKSQTKPIVVVQMARAPFGRADGFGMEFLPDCAVIQRAIDLLKARAYLVQIGAGETLYKFSGIDLDLSNQTAVSDVIDIGYVAAGFLGQCSFIIPLAESFRKPALLVWSRKGLQSPQAIIRKMTPQKILHRESSRYVVDDCLQCELADAVDALLEQIRDGGTV